MAGSDTLLDLAEDFSRFCAWAGIDLYPWQRDAFGAATRRESGRFVHRLAGISVPRGNGKSFAAAVVALWRLVTGHPPQDLLSVALDFEGARVVLDHAKRIVRGNPGLDRAIEVRADALIVPSTESRWQIRSREHRASRGLHPNLIIYDEVGWARDDELFSSLLASQASASDPLCLVVSTVGHHQVGPLWRVKRLAEDGDPTVLFWHSPENLSPRVTPEFLARQQRLLLPLQYLREHTNQWVDGADAFVTAAEVADAMTGDWVESDAGEPGVEYAMFVDLGLVHDATAIAVGHAEEELACMDALVTLQGSRERPVQLTAVEAAILDLAARFSLTEVRVETWQGMGVAQNLERIGLPVSVAVPTARSNAEEWAAVKSRLASRTLVLPVHDRLRAELLGLTAELGPAGLRVSDRGRVHQDHAVAVRGVVAMLDAAQRRVPFFLY